METPKFILRMKDDEKESFKRAAELSEQNLSDWIRSKLRAACIKELKKYGEKPGFVKD